MAKTTILKDSLTGRWRLIWTEVLNQELVDERIEGYFATDKEGCGNFQLGPVHGVIDGCIQINARKSRFEFSWHGNDHMLRRKGRGWVVVAGDRIAGSIIIEGGGKTRFLAERQLS